MPTFKPKPTKNITISKKKMITLDGTHREFMNEFAKDEYSNIPKLKQKKRILLKQLEEITTTNNKSIEETADFFKNNSVDIRPFFYPINKHRHLMSIINDDEVAELLNKEVIMIPSSPTITIEEQTYVVEIINLFI